jgi:hypothetical protein
MEMQAQNIEIMMQQRMMNQMENIEEKQEHREELKERRQLQRDLRQHELDISIQPPRGPHAPLPSSPELSFRSPLYRTSTPQALSALATAGPTPTPTPQPRPPAPTYISQTSSPIDIAEEDANILEAFFNWKLRITRNLERRAKWERARKIINDNN